MSAPAAARAGGGPRRVALALAVAALALAAGATGCSGDPVATSGVPAPAPPSERLAFVVVGGNETEEGPVSASSPGRSWAHQVFSGLPPSAVLVDLSDRGASARDTIDRQLARARTQRPTVAAVWLGQGDVDDGTSVPAFTEAVTSIVRDLQASGASRVLLLRRPPDGAADRGAPGGAGAGRYAAALDAVAAETQAAVVPLPAGTEPLSATAVADAVRRQMPA